ncbi:RsmB/NOP family class I SAM-dependent RNA methyltransferase [Sphingomonas sp. NSE70-1]|uniref:RsmB/NOP family class I SAM-dependent RNA methyltransferase n=1 Tax=Sphingomonas caseinilyticus TaxID=2908205 RepID=A0ABT0RRT0_9SPHN|nr:RsmB/NOP family class I SAM-dependent RNA methyltransferase [Sphingomonas caseinilyticus]MCL6697713.1 RsmB/NOP family class I SAM-dependent RNA methyltransferase [Sphingomonas caseinilyticus]
MTPSARVQAAIEILDEVIASVRQDGAPADAIVTRYFKARRYAGSKDRRAVRELVFRAIRRSGEVPASGRSAMLGLADEDAMLLDLFDGSPHGPAVREPADDVAKPSAIPQWVQPLLSGHVTEAEWPALLERAPIDLRVNAARASRDELIGQFEGAETAPHSPWGLRLPPDTRVDDHPAFLQGLVEIQDEGSQLIALACQSSEGARILDLCAGAGGKALALAAASPGSQVIATDTNRARLAQLAPRAQRAVAEIEVRLLDGGRESAQLAELEGQCDIVLVDAPCSGSGTWRRNPEGRWRLSPDRLDRLVHLQQHLLDIAAPLVKPGGALVYATCSIIRAEGTDQARNFLGRHSSWIVQDMPFEGGRADGPGRLLTPAHDATDGFFVARFAKPC